MFNPNRAGSYSDAELRNRAISDRFEPGSTIKPFTIAGALEENAITARTPIFCENGAYTIAEYTIHDTHPWGTLTPQRVLAVSSNIGTAKIGAALGRSRLYQALRRFGFGQKTEVPLPGETSGVLRHYKGWYDADVSTISFGQGFSVNILQMAQAYGALANQGELAQLRLVKRVVDRNGRGIDLQPQWRRQAVSPKTAQLVTQMLTSVTEAGGTGTAAAVDGVLVAGKTGTAQKSDVVSGGYARDKWVASFVGFVPANDPRFVIAVSIDEPKVVHLGGQVAAPVFRRVAEAALRQSGILAATSHRTRASDVVAPVPERRLNDSGAERSFGGHAGRVAVGGADIKVRAE
jgi:cell division protein FtsI (penicillin-binding protein 3)